MKDENCVLTRALPSLLVLLHSVLFLPPSYSYLGDLSLLQMSMFLHRFSPQPGSSVELSSSGYQFLTDLFKKYDKVGWGWGAWGCWPMNMAHGIDYISGLNVFGWLSLKCRTETKLSPLRSKRSVDCFLKMIMSHELLFMFGLE